MRGVFVPDAQQRAFGQELEAGWVREQRLLVFRGVWVGPEHELSSKSLSAESAVVFGEAQLEEPSHNQLTSSTFLIRHSDLYTI